MRNAFYKFFNPTKTQNICIDGVSKKMCPQVYRKVQKGIMLCTFRRADPNRENVSDPPFF